MRFLRAFAIAFITAVVGMFLAVFASDYLTKLYHVPDMERQRGMTIIFLFAPLGIMVARKTKRGLSGFSPGSAPTSAPCPSRREWQFVIAYVN